MAKKELRYAYALFNKDGKRLSGWRALGAINVIGAQRATTNSMNYRAEMEAREPEVFEGHKLPDPCDAADWIVLAKREPYAEAHPKAIGVIVGTKFIPLRVRKIDHNKRYQEPWDNWNGSHLCKAIEKEKENNG